MSEAVDLHYELRGDGGGPRCPVLILHGLFGSLANWRTLARSLADARFVYSVDLRNHGRSPHARPHDYAAMAADCERFVRDRVGRPVDVVGHSMGGRVAMHLALGHGELVRRLVVIDISPKSSATIEPRSILEALLAVDPGRHRARSDVDAELAARVADPALRAWLLMNLEKRADGRLAWRIGLEEIAEAFDRPPTPLPAGCRLGPCLFVRGARSPYLPTADEPFVRSLFPDAEIVTIAGAGHMPHVDAPRELARVIAGFLAA